MGGINEKYEVELKPNQWTYLESMAEKHGLPDPSKALRCLVNYAIEEGSQEGAIFQEIRCTDC